jgi:hypothetical protein
MLKVLKPAKRPRSAPKAAGRRRQRQVVKRARDLIDPVPPERMDCVHDVIFAVRAIAKETLHESSREMKSQLKVVEKAFRKARFALKGLSDQLRYHALVALDAPERFIGDLDRLIERCDPGKIRPRRIQCLSEAGKKSNQSIKDLIAAGHLTTRIDEPKGGSRAARLNAAQKESATIDAFELLARYDGRFPKGERFNTLASLLIEAATGRAGVDCKAACLATSKTVSRQDAFDERAWRRRESPTTA